MLSRRPLRAADRPTTSHAKRAHHPARHDALRPDHSDTGTRKIGPSPAAKNPAYDGSLAGAPCAAAHPATDSEPRAYFLTVDGGVLAEIPCRASAGTIVIGRGQQSDIRLNDPYVHRVHAELRWDDDERAHVITHGGGQNGTYVNRHRVQRPFRLVGGEALQFGKTRLHYRIRH